LLVLAAGCGHSEPHTAVVIAPAKPRPPYVHKVQVTVLDGDTGRRLRGARVTVGRRSALTNAHGVVLVPAPRGATLLTRIDARGYVPASSTVSFRRYPSIALSVYRPSLQWTMYGANAARTQVQPQIHLRPPFRLLWSRSLYGLIEFPAVVSEGKAYIGNARGTVFAIDMTNGDVIWRHLVPHGKMAASPAVWGDRIVVHGMDGRVSLLRVSDGRLLSRFNAGAAIESSPLVRDGIDYFGSWNGVVEALDLRRGRLLWTYRSGCKITSSAAISGSTLYIGDYCGRLLALGVWTGRLRWAGAVNGRIYGTPAVAGGRVFVGSSDGGSMSAFSTGGSLIWRRYFGSYVYSSPAVWGGRVFFGTYAGAFYALDAANGATRWSVGTGGPISGAAAVVDGIAYAGSFAHRIVGVDARGGRVVLNFPHGEYVPVSGDGRRLLLHGYSRLYAVTER
jgi:outer membrane protein assembly factor BamB